MGRAPCCEKMGLKKGPWTQEEDLILVNHINTHGHKNWRALPKQAALLRCGKSCRLRWTNYLRPGIKRGNFTREEEDTIIQLHEMLGNRWSAIAARLPGRTDNEIKNVWHTRLKKKQMQSALALDAQKQEEKLPVNFPTHHHVNVIKAEMPPPSSQQCSSSDMSTLTTSDNNEHNSHNFTNNHGHVSMNNSAESLDDDFWSQVLSAHNSNETKSGFPAGLKNPFSPPLLTEEGVHLATSSSLCDSIDLIFGSMI